jgi:hypothetical protein
VGPNPGRLSIHHNALEINFILRSEGQGDVYTVEVEFTADVSVGFDETGWSGGMYSEAGVDIRPIASDFPWRVEWLRGNLIMPETRVPLAILGGASPGVYLEVFETIQVRRLPSGSPLRPYATTLPVNWELAPESPFTAAPLSFSREWGDTVNLSVTATGLKMLDDENRCLTLLDRFGVGFSIENLRASGQQVTVLVDGMPPRRHPRFSSSAYLQFSITEAGSGGITRFSLSGTGGFGTDDINISSSLNSPIEVSLEAAHIGLTCSAVPDVSLLVSRPGTFIDKISAQSLTLFSQGPVDFYIRELDVRVLSASDLGVKVIAGTVTGLSWWTVDLTVRVGLSLLPDAASPSFPVSSRWVNVPLTVGQDATIVASLSAGFPTFLNSSSFAGSRYYIEPGSLPALAGRSQSGWPGVPARAGQQYDFYPLVCGVDCGKFEALLKDYSWFTKPDPIYNPQTAKQTCVKYSDVYQVPFSNADPSMTCVVLKPVDSIPSSTSVVLTYTEAVALARLPYEYRVNDLSEATREITISGQVGRADLDYNLIPIEIDFSGTPIRDAQLTFAGLPPRRPVALKASPGHIGLLSLPSLEGVPGFSIDDPVLFVAANSSDPLSPRSLALTRSWYVAPDDVNWSHLTSVRVPLTYHRNASEYISGVPTQYIDHVHAFPDLAGTTLTLSNRSIQLTRGEADAVTFNAPADGSFDINIEFGGYGNEVRAGNLAFAGSGPINGGQYVLDFAGCSGRTVLPLDTPSWIPPPGLVIARASEPAFDIGAGATRSVSFTLFYPGTILLGCPNATDCQAQETVEFKRLIRTSSLAFSKGPNTAVTIDDLELYGAASDPCSGSAVEVACKGVTVKAAHLYTGAVIPSGYIVTEQVWIDGSVEIDPLAFRQQAVYHFTESSYLRFSGTIPENAPTIVAPFNLTGTRRTATQIVRTQHNNSVFGEFDLSERETRKIVCADQFSEQSCTKWKDALANGMTITENDWGSGVTATLTLECGSDPEGGYVFDFSASAVIPVLRTELQCLFAALNFTGGDPTTPHDSGSTIAGSNAAAGGTERLGAGGAAAIALGVILAIVILVVVVLIVSGKLTFTHAPDPLEDGLNGA